MNAKETNMLRLQKARTAHLKWVNSVKLLVSGFTLDKKALTPLVQDTECGKWFYNEGIQFSQFNSRNVLNEMDEMLEAMFDIFAKIYAIYYGSGNGVKSLLGLKKTVNKYEIELASRCYEDIVNISDKFKNRFGVLERQLYALSDEKHELIMISTHLEKDTPKNIETVKEEDAYYGPRSH